MAFQQRRRRRPAQEAPAQADGPDANPMDVAREIALRRLTLRDHSRQELDEALAAKEVPEDVREALLARFEELGLVNDQNFAEQWTRARRSSRKLSRAAVRRELQAKGIDRDLIDETLEPIDHESEVELATELARKKWRSVHSLPREVAYRRMAGTLARKGYSSSVVTQVLREVVQAEPEEF
ncbi:regulatory protein [Luteococcus japonicus]|uniref:Regulatory protein RecX n=2 Tax=Luteococcus japonicus TaxID=33984 RepID=A0A1R4JSN8_9ACTN|nr:regulatory protein RecX [Luteococcus japonicus]ROR55923.1 regulatory protein [Luteococcus japonicus]SJN35009.1 Regulatory protein RecX [Luteococcus japonicus LSP_Lj1]